MVAQGQSAALNSAQRLARSITRYSDEKLQRFRDVRRILLREMAGPWFGVEYQDINQGPLRLLHLLASILVPSLHNKTRPTVATRSIALRPFSSNCELAAEFLLKESWFDEVFRVGIVDSFAGRGIFWTGVGSSHSSPGGLIEPEGFLADPGRPITRSIIEDDFLQDLSAQEWDAQSFMGHRFRLPYEWAMDVGYYDRRELERIHGLQAGMDSDRNAAGDGMRDGQDERFVEEIELAQVWAPRHDAILTIPGRMAECQKYLAEEEYVGPETGPYDVLGYMPMPGSLLPIPPFSVVLGLHRTLNRIAEHMRELAVGAKTVLVTRPGQEKLGNALVNAENCDHVSGDPDAVKAVAVGGVTPDMYQSVEFFYGFWNKLSNNPEITGGLGRQSNTLGQDELIAGSANVSLGDKRERVRLCKSSCIRKQMWHLWNSPDESLNIPLTLQLGYGAEIPLAWTPDAREGDFADFEFDVQAFDATGDTPEKQFANIVTWVRDVLAPVAALAGPAGQALDAGKVAEVSGKLLNIRQANEMFRQAQPMEMPDVSMGGQTTNINQGRPRGAGGGQKMLGSAMNRPARQAQPAAV